MRVCEGRVNLDGSGVALQSSLYVVHLLQSVAHVGVSIGEGGLNSKKFFWLGYIHSGEHFANAITRILSTET